jgi:hypothetical protein
MPISLPGRDMMWLPQGDIVFIEAAKIRDYLLDLGHPRGRTKAQFFYSQGFRLEQWPLLVLTLKMHALNGMAELSQRRADVEYWQVVGPLETPSGKRPLVISVWEIQNNGVPRLITAYPED